MSKVNYISVEKWKNSYKMASKSSKNSKSTVDCHSCNTINLATVDLSSKVDCRLQGLVPSTGTVFFLNEKQGCFDMNELSRFHGHSSYGMRTGQAIFATNGSGGFSRWSRLNIHTRVPYNLTDASRDAKRYQFSRAIATCQRQVLLYRPFLHGSVFRG
jgi:hypothetical protein